MNWLLLDQLDGFSRKRKRSLSVDDSSEISLTDYLNRQEKKLNKPGKKRVCENTCNQGHKDGGFMGLLKFCTHINARSKAGFYCTASGTMFAICTDTK